MGRSRYCKQCHGEIMVAFKGSFCSRRCQNFKYAIPRSLERHYPQLQNMHVEVIDASQPTGVRASLIKEFKELRGME